MKKQNINPKGFTIIEVILVLAIGSLIILMALVALPSLQASQRDTQRKTDYSTLEAAITSYSSNNRGKLPGKKATIITYIAGGETNWADPSYGEYTIYFPNATPDSNNNISSYTKQSYTAPAKNTTANREEGTTMLDQGEVFIYISSECNGDKPQYNSKLGARRYAIYGYLENGTYCQAN